MITDNAFHSIPTLVCAQRLCERTETLSFVENCRAKFKERLLPKILTPTEPNTVQYNFYFEDNFCLSLLSNTHENGMEAKERISHAMNGSMPPWNPSLLTKAPNFLGLHPVQCGTGWDTSLL